VEGKARFVVVGGFLGAGKTTALLRLGTMWQERGRRVGLLTNDQAADLVDTETIRMRGFRVEEVAGACFCCKFDDLARSAERLREEERPDVLVGEPVGSCTDLVATVVRPLAKFYGDRYEVAPYSVLVDPARARAIVLEKGFGGFSAKVAYVFLKQLEEADLILLNKADLLAPAAREEIRAALGREFPRARVLPASALTGEGFEEWLALLEGGGPAGAHAAEVDYEIYAEGEAELGWLNATWRLESDRPFDADRIVGDLLQAIAEGLRPRGAEVAHVKVLLDAGGGAAVGNFVGAGSAVRLSQALGREARAGRLVVNARVHTDPDALLALAEACVASVLAVHGVAARRGQAAHFRPGRPVPVHRLAEPV
jgi:G3E family GTPase